jgi:hypothetical protein
MSLTTALLQEFDNEAKTTRRVLERVPNDKLGWKPHPKSMSLGVLALHVGGQPCCHLRLGRRGRNAVQGRAASGPRLDRRDPRGARSGRQDER